MGRRWDNRWRQAPAGNTGEKEPTSVVALLSGHSDAMPEWAVRRPATDILVRTLTGEHLRADQAEMDDCDTLLVASTADDALRSMVIRKLMERKLVTRVVQLPDVSSERQLYYMLGVAARLGEDSEAWPQVAGEGVAADSGEDTRLVVSMWHVMGEVQVLHPELVLALVVEPNYRPRIAAHPEIETRLSEIVQGVVLSAAARSVSGDVIDIHIATAGDGALRIEVIDNGAMIPAEEVSRLGDESVHTSLGFAAFKARSVGWWLSAETSRKGGSLVSLTVPAAFFA